MILHKHFLKVKSDDGLLNIKGPVLAHFESHIWNVKKKVATKSKGMTSKLCQPN